MIGESSELKTTGEMPITKINEPTDIRSINDIIEKKCELARFTIPMAAGLKTSQTKFELLNAA